MNNLLLFIFACLDFASSLKTLFKFANNKLYYCHMVMEIHALH